MGSTGLTPAPRKYPDELRERAVREVQNSGRPVAHVARDFGIHKEALRLWVRQAEAGLGSRPDLLTSAERAELVQLRKEAAELRRANEILKAAGVFFAKELDRPRTKACPLNASPDQHGAEDRGRAVDDRELVEPRGQAPPLLEQGEGPLDHVAVLVGHRIELRRTPAC